MTIASLLLALLTATDASRRRAIRPGLSCSTSTPNGAARASKMRPAVEQLIRNGYPIKSIDIDQEPERRRRDTVSTAFRPSSWSTARGRELDRTIGLQSAAELARFYKAAAAKAQPPANSNAHVGSRDDARAESTTTTMTRRDEPGRERRRRRPRRSSRDRDAERSEPAFTNPKPWETVVRIKVLSNRSTGFGSGTIIYSTPEESLILTCAISSSSKGSKQASPGAVPAPDRDRPVRRQAHRASKPAKVHYLEVGRRARRSITTSRATSG